MSKLWANFLNDEESIKLISQVSSSYILNIVKRFNPTFFDKAENLVSVLKEKKINGDNYFTSYLFLYFFQNKNIMNIDNFIKEHNLGFYHFYDISVKQSLCSTWLKALIEKTNNQSFKDSLAIIRDINSRNHIANVNKIYNSLPNLIFLVIEKEKLNKETNSNSPVIKRKNRI